MDEINIFSERLREARLKQKLTQKELANKANIAPATLSAYERSDAERGKRPSLENAMRLAEALDVSLDWLCGSKKANVEPDATIIPLQAFFRCLASVAQVSTSIGFKTERIEDVYDDFTYTVAYMKFENRKIVRFLESLSKMLALLKDKSVPQKMFNEWLSGNLAQYEEQVIDLATKQISKIDDFEEYEEIDLGDDLPL